MNTQVNTQVTVDYGCHALHSLFDCEVDPSCTDLRRVPYSYCPVCQGNLADVAGLGLRNVAYLHFDEHLVSFIIERGSSG